VLVTRIEAGATLEAPPTTVWGDIVAHERWPEWFGRGAAEAPLGEGTPEGRPAGGLRLDEVTLLQGEPDRVGTERACAGTLGPLLPLLPLPGGLGSRPLRWRDCIADVHAPWLLEVDVQGARRPFARARLRLILVPGEAGHTRLRLRLTYAPGFFWWPLDVLLLRRAVAGGLREALAGLEARYRQAPAQAPGQAPGAFQEPAPEAGPEADAGAVSAAA
jgi:hypothetical protein